MKRLNVFRGAKQWGICLSVLLSLLLGGCFGMMGAGESTCTSNPPPRISSFPPLSATVGVLYLYQVKASYSCLFGICGGVEGLQLPSGASIHSGYVWWTPGQGYANQDVPFSIATYPDLICGNRATQSWTVHVSDFSPPTRLSTFPTNSAADVPVDTVINVAFSESVDPRTVNSSSFFVTGPSGPVAGKIAVSGTTATFTPSSYLAYLSTYTATITAAVTDLSGNALASSFIWTFTTGMTPDTSPPSIPTGWSATAVSSSQIDMSWNASLDNVGMAGYKIYKDGSYWQSVANVTSFTDAGLLLNARYCYAISAFDMAGNESAQGGAACVSTLDLVPGSVGAWGGNKYGQLGDGTLINKGAPVQVMGLGNILSIAGGSNHSIALQSDGTVWAWGDNQFGQLGDGTMEGKVSPERVNNLNNITSIAGGGYHSIALQSNGSVWAWGYNYHGQLGDGTAVTSIFPMPVSNLSNVIAIAGGGSHSLALKSDGTVWAWGGNFYGQLGDDTTTNRNAPVQVLNLSNIIAVAAGTDHSLALRSDGSVWAWGGNYAGQVGNGTYTDRWVAPQMINVGNVIAVSAAKAHSLALAKDGTVWEWGTIDWGDGTSSTRLLPDQVMSLSNIIAVASGGDHALVLKSDGAIWAWGDNGYGQLGDGTTIDQYTPIRVPNLSAIAAISAGLFHSMALK